MLLLLDSDESVTTTVVVFVRCCSFVAGRRAVCRSAVIAAIGLSFVCLFVYPNPTPLVVPTSGGGGLPLRAECTSHRQLSLPFTDADDAPRLPVGSGCAPFAAPPHLPHPSFVRFALRSCRELLCLCFLSVDFASLSLLRFSLPPLSLFLLSLALSF